MRVWGRVVAAIATVVTLGISCVDASAEMREITIGVKFCGGGDCTTAGAYPVKIDWTGETIEFIGVTTLRGNTLRFGRTVRINESYAPSDIQAREPTLVRVQKDGLRLTIEETNALDITATIFEKSITTYTFVFRSDGECASFTMVKKVLQQSRKQDTGSGVGVSCRGRIDVGR